jgi:hypothetical protein
MISLPVHTPSPEHEDICRIDLRLGGPVPRTQVLMVGNSLTHFHLLGHMVQGLASAVGKGEWLVSTCARYGATLTWHREFGYATGLIEGGPAWDFITFQDFSDRPAVAADASAADLEHWAGLARNRGATPVGYATWDILGREPLADAIEDTHRRGMAPSQGLVAPAGRAFRRIRQARPDLELYRDDGKHQTALGSFVAAAAIAKTLTGALPVQAPERLLAGGYEDFPESEETLAEVLAIVGEEPLRG